MTDLKKELAELEAQMTRLCDLRNSRIAQGQALIDRANKEFDRNAVTLGRRINLLRELTAEPKEPTTPVTRKDRYHADPEWSQDDIDHFNELAGRGR